MSLHRPRLSLLASAALVAGLFTAVASPPVTAAPVSPAAADIPAVLSTAAVGDLAIENSFVSAVGWVKPGDTYPSRIILTNSGSTPATGAEVAIAAPEGSTILTAGTTAVDGPTYTWDVPDIPAGESRTLVLESRADSTDELSTIVWRDLSTTATLAVGGASREVTSHGPKVIPPGGEFDTARYGDRPFPIVPVQYRDRAYGEHENDLDTVINDPEFEGSTFNLFQEMSLGQLYPEGTVPSTGIESAGFDYEPGFDFTEIEPGQTCTGLTGGATAPGTVGGIDYSQRITDGVYNLPGQTQYYGADANGSAVIGALAGVGALQAIDSGCGPTGKLVYDAAAIADPEIDYSDFDTDKDGVVDFFMVVFAGCGGNGASQLSVAGCDLPNPNTGLPDAPYDNIWPHSSSLEFSYSDPETGLAGYTTDDQLKNLEGEPLWYTDDSYTEMTTVPGPDALKVFVRVGPYNVNPETAIDAASVISHEYGHSLGLPDFYSTGSRGTYGDWNLMATDKSHHIDAFGRQELGWVVPEVLDTSGTENDITDSKQDTDTIIWQTPDGTPYTLTEGADGRVQNSQMYVAKLPGRILLDTAKFETGDKASATHTWWSRSGNDFGCAKDVGKGHNFDIAMPELADLPAGTTVSLDFKSMWDIEWDYDYGYVLTSTDGGQSFGSNPSENGYTTSNTDPLAGNPNQVACQTHYDNGLTGTSGSYQAGSEAVDRKAGNTPEMIYLADSYDISELAGADLPVLRFSYATDPGLARPGWFIDDVKVTATLPDGSTREIYATDFESDGGPDDPRIFNGGCQGDAPGGNCTQGWQYVAAGEEGPSDHAYYLEMRDRSGFDLDGNGQADRGAPEFQSGLYLSYTDEAHGYGNVGTDDPPAQSPLDSQPEPGNGSPDLNDAAWTAVAGDNRFTDSGEGHTDNYSDPSTESGNWEFTHNCLTFDVLSMSGNGDGTVAGEQQIPDVADGDLTGAVDFTMGTGCGEYDYGYVAEDPAAEPPASQAPVAAATATPTEVATGEEIIFDGGDSTDPDSPAGDLHYAWNFDDDGESKDAEGVRVAQRYVDPGTYTIRLTVTDPEGNSDTDEVVVTVTGESTGGGDANQAPTAAMRVPDSPMNDRRVRLSAARSSDPESGDADLTYSWNFGDGGSSEDATGRVVRTRFREAGPRRITLTVTDPQGASDRTSERIVVRREIVCSSGEVRQDGSWRKVRDDRARGNSYCDNLGRGRGRDVLRTTFRGGYLDVFHGRSSRGGVAHVFVDGDRVGKVRFGNDRERVRVRHHKVFRGLGGGEHTLRLVVRRGAAYVDGFIVKRPR